MELKIVFNSNAIGDEFSLGWGLSILVGKNLLFDTGETEEALLNNIKKLKIDISLIEKVVISHDHWDHTGGLWGLLKGKKGIKVYGCAGFSQEFKDKVSSAGAKLIVNKDFLEISKNVYLSGEIIGDYNGQKISEQALVIEDDKGIGVLTGCAHPGIVNILKSIKGHFIDKEFAAVLGGFHLMNKTSNEIKEVLAAFKNLKVKKAGPTHCSGPKAQDIFKAQYRDNFIEALVGTTIKI